MNEKIAHKCLAPCRQAGGTKHQDKAKHDTKFIHFGIYVKVYLETLKIYTLY